MSVENRPPQSTCPNCGYCPSCGRSASPWYPQPYPWFPSPIWVSPTWQQPRWTWSISTIDGFNTNMSQTVISDAKVMN